MVYRIDPKKRNSLTKKYLVKYLIQLIPGALIVATLIWLDNLGDTSLSTSSIIFLLLIPVLLSLTFNNALNKQLNYELLVLDNRIESQIGKTIQYIHWNSVNLRELDNGDLILEDKNVSQYKLWQGIGKISIYNEFRDFEQLKSEIRKHVNSVT